MEGTIIRAAMSNNLCYIWYTGFSLARLNEDEPIKDYIEDEDTLKEIE